MKIGGTSSFQEDDSETGLLGADEGSPLLMRHMSMEKQAAPCHGRQDFSTRTVSTVSSSSMMSTNKTNGKVQVLHRYFPPLAVLSMVAIGLMAWYTVARAWQSHASFSVLDQRHIVSIDNAKERYVQVDSGISLWLRTWGNTRDGIPVLFVHGGPGNAIADYGNSNADFFDAHRYLVVEVDQRGTGQSQPSVRDSAANMAFYHDISVDQMAADYEKVRAALGIRQWLVFGGSFGSTLGLYYATHYPEACLGLIIRGIYLDTETEMQAVYARSSHLHHPSRLAAFDTLYKYAATASLERNGSGNARQLDPNDARAITTIYADLIQSGDRQAIWHWHAYENNLMETDPANLLDPTVIDNEVFPEAQSVAYFETRLWLRGVYEQPINLLQSVPDLVGIPYIQICQGRHDLVCPAEYTKWLTNALDDARATYGVRYLNSGHEQSDPVMARCLLESLDSFYYEYPTAHTAQS